MTVLECHQISDFLQHLHRHCVDIHFIESSRSTRPLPPLVPALLPAALRALSASLMDKPHGHDCHCCGHHGHIELALTSFPNADLCWFLLGF